MSTARIGLAFAEEDDGSVVLGGIKNNVGPLASTLAFRIVPTADLARIEWLGAVNRTTNEVLNRVPRKSRGECAVAWLEDRFRESREWRSDDLHAAAKNFGLSRSSLWSPEVQALPIVKRKRMTQAGEPYWTWIAGENWPEKQN
jgi:hypothetical protein